ncbi:hypothetical protein MettiDRAFT_1284 [Methanolobus tindarius DSM 2278]|uniref:Uncharacterized protein n=1 Tax=Methanolobus tindarius DSM 2278 TaxID=1090322 RepID=W9DQP0_METTI|nr:hypothetical protein MettiDRAFT_1284 [Methanolobus tindarius DSM 2278]
MYGILSIINHKKSSSKMSLVTDYLSIRSLALCIVFIGIILCSCLLVSTTPWVGSTLTNVSYVEQEGWKKLDTEVTVSSTTDNFTDGYLIVNITDNSSSYDALRVVSNSSLNVSGNALYWDGNRIGTIDNTYDGSNGILRIDFNAVAPLSNSNFETGDLSNWIINDSYTGVTAQEWVESPADDDDVPDGNVDADPLYDDHRANDVPQTASVQSSTIYEGSYALRLDIDGHVDGGYGTAHGPLVISTGFTAAENDSITLNWYAADSGDWYDVYGFIFRDDNNDGVWDDDEEYQKLFHDVGSDTGGWITTSANVSSNVAGSNVRFAFLNGNYDASGGQAIGSYLCIDGIVLEISNTMAVNNTMVESIIENIEYSNEDDNPEVLKNYSITLKESNYDVDSNTAVINITPVNDAPGVPGNITNPLDGYSVARGDTITVNWGNATDPESDEIYYDVWFYNGTWTQIGSMVNTSSMSFTMPSDNVTEAKFKVYANDTLLNSSEVNVTFGILDAPEFTYTPANQEQLTTYDEELNFTIESTLLSSFEWLVDGSPISGSGFSIVNTSNSSYCLINASQYINDSDFFMDSYNISVVVNNASLRRNDTYSWDWTVTESSATDEGEDISFIVNGSVNTTSYGNESYVRINTTYDDDLDENGLNCSITFVEFNTTENPSGILLKVEVVNKTSINVSGAGFTHDDVYQYIDIGFSNETLVNNDSYSRNIEFRVLDKLNGGSLVINSVALKHLKTGVWETYTPTKLSDDGTYSYFVVYNVSGFSPFAVLADYSSSSSTTSNNDDGLPYYLRKQLLEQASSEETEEESPEEPVNAESSFVENSENTEDIDTYQVTSSSSGDTIKDDDGNTLTMVFSGIILVAFMLLLFIWKKKKDEEQ